MADNATERPGPDVSMSIPAAIPDDDEFAPTEADFANLTDTEANGLREFMAGDEPETSPDPEEAASEPEVATPAAQEPPPEPEPVQIDLTEKITAKDEELNAIRAKNQELMDQWNDGEIAEDAFNRQMRENEQQMISLSSELGGLRGMQTSLTETTAAEQRQRQAAEDASWQRACQAFEANNTDLFGQEHRAGFDRTVRTVTADPRVAALPFDEQLRYAAERYADDQRRFGGPVPDLAAGGPAGPKKSSTSTEPETPSRRDPPMTLAHVPNSAADPNQSEAATLAAQIARATDPDVREQLVARIPEDQFDSVMSLMPE